MHPLTTVLSQVPTEAFMERVLDAQLDKVAPLIVILVLFFLIIATGAVVFITRVVGQGINRQSDALESERSERQKLTGMLEAHRLRTNALEKKIEDLQDDARDARARADRERNDLTSRLEAAEKRLREQEQAFNDERTKMGETVRKLNEEIAALRKELTAEHEESLSLYAENEQLRNERDNLLKRNNELERRVDELERRIDELSQRVDKRATDETPAAANGTVAESKIATQPLSEIDVAPRQPTEGD